MNDKPKFNIPREYELVASEYLEDIGSEGLILRHKKTMARVCVMPNDDPNKFFCIAFKTPPEDSSGVAHIIEHTVLCGSRKYPAREPFMKLVKSSLHTFLNAMTYPDKTMYPVSSCNDTDFKNLMDVYLDAVFYPNIYGRKEIFMQEGWHYEIESKDDEININGVVYNEMKGKASSPDSEIFEQLLYAMFPDNAYGFNSGGDPESIPDLSYEKYLDFHRKYYHPSNSYIALYGNMDMEERLSYLDREYLSDFEFKNIDSSIKSQPRFNKGNERNVTVNYPISEEDDVQNKTYLAFGSLCCSSFDAVESIAWDFLGEALINSSNAPIKKALIEAGIGQEIYGGFINHMAEPAFAIIAKNTEEERREEFVRIIRESLEKLSREGINKNSLKAEIERSEFRFREAAYGAYPKGLDYFKSMLQSWLYDDGDPFKYLRVLEIYKELKSKIDEGYFESLVEKILSSEHCAVVALAPEVGLNEKNEKALSDKLLKYKNGLSDNELSAIIEENKSLIEYQNAPETEEERNCIPILSRENISKISEPIYNRETTIGNFPAVVHDIPTNGIAYVRIMFDISGVDDENLTYVDFLSDVLGKIDTEQRSYAEILDDVKLNTGSLVFDTATYRKYKRRNEFTPYFVVSLRALSDKIDKSLDIIEEIICGSIFDDYARIKELLAEMVSEKSRDIVYCGDEYASGRCLAYFDSAAAFDEKLEGIESYNEQSALLNDYDRLKTEISGKLKSVAGQIFTRGGAMISTAAGDDDLAFIDKKLKALYDKLPSEEIKRIERFPLGRLNEGYLSSSQVQYVAMGTNLFDYGFKCDGKLLALAAAIQNDVLYPTVRMKGGAYGCSCAASPDSGNFLFASYRDPNLEETIKTFKNIHMFVEDLSMDEETLNGLIIGVFSRIDRPTSVFQKINRSFAAYISGKTYEDIVEERGQILNMKKEEFAQYSDMLKIVMKNDFLCVIGGESKIKEERDYFLSLKRV